MLSFAPLTLANAAFAVASIQHAMQLQAPLQHAAWSFELTREWHVLGPFPLSAREQHLILPSFPLKLTLPYQHDPNATFFSSIPDGGRVNWSQTQLNDDNILKISFPDVRWEHIRATEGWAGLQHHSLARSQITIYPPSDSSDTNPIPRLLVDIQRASFFAVTPTDSNCDITQGPEWHPANIYEIAGYSKASVDLPCLSLDGPTVYDIFISVDYEIRLFGDPLRLGSPVPVSSVGVDLSLEVVEETVKVVENLVSVPDFVEGFAFGNVLSVGVRSVNGSWTLVRVDTHSKGVRLAPLRNATIIGSQTRDVPLSIVQDAALCSDHLAFEMVFELDWNGGGGKKKPRKEGRRMNVPVMLPIRNHSLHKIIHGEPILGTHYQAGTLSFLAISPSNASATPSLPVIFLHGAGVDVVSDRTWSRAIPQQERSWILTPTGRTSWGYDWRGPSSLSVFDALSTLRHLVPVHGLPAIPQSSKVVLFGHSNGGQGVWHNAARWPDEVAAAVPAAAYIKAQSYISTANSWAAHFHDPSLRGILDGSLTHDDNDLFLTNMANIPTLALHGGEDDNVPTWHSRLLTSVLRYLSFNETGSLLEIPGMSHWWDEIFRSHQVGDFLDGILATPSTSSPGAAGREPFNFTLTSLFPSEGGTLKGFRILQPLIPGRLSRLEAQEDSLTGTIMLNTINIAAFWVPVALSGQQLVIDKRVVKVGATNEDGLEGFILARGGRGRWKVATEDDITARDVGRLASVLNTRDVITIIYPAENPHAHRIALRFSWTLNLYLKLDTRIVTVDEYRDPNDEIYGNLIVLRTGDGVDFDLNFSSTEGASNARMANNTSGLELNDDGLWIGGKVYNRPSSGALILTSNGNLSGSKVLHIWGIDHAGLERAALLLPFRTGIYGPEWIVLDDRPGAVAAAGFWNDEWLSWNEAMSWLG